MGGGRKKEITGENGEVSTASVPTQTNPTFSREDLGAVISAAKIGGMTKVGKKKPIARLVSNIPQRIIH